MDRNHDTRISSLLLAAGAGALAMYLLDPQQGRRRVALARDKVTHLARVTGDTAEAGLRDLGHRTTGLVAERSRSPMPRNGLLPMAGGTLLALYGLGRRGLPGVVLGLAGAGLALRAWPGRGRPIVVDKTIHIAATPQQVFDLWSNYDNFPLFMSKVEEVRRIDDTRSHWVVKGPGGVRLEWDAVITDREPGRLLAWRSEPDSTIYHAGTVRFDPAPEGTAVSVHMSYRPPGGTLGHAVATLLGRNPRQEVDADLMRMKSFIETGRTPHDAAQPGPRGPMGR
jgi:uncharacterized membrane protein